MIVLLIDEPTPSLNILLGQHWTKNIKHRRRWHWLVKQALMRSNVYIPPKWSRARIRIERYGARILDADNFRGGTKALIDALKLEEVIVDDSPEVIGEPELKQIAGKERGTRVYVEQLA